MRLTTSGIVRNGLVLIDLDLNAALRCELRYEHTVGNLLEDDRIVLATKTVVEGVKVGSSDDELEVCRLKRTSVIHSRIQPTQCHLRHSNRTSRDRAHAWGHSRTADLCLSKHPSAS